MNNLETLHALLDAAGMADKKMDFQEGSLVWERTRLSESTEVIARLKALVEDGADGWILFADRIVEPDGTWDAQWENDHPLDAELTVNGRSIRLTHRNGTWTLAEAGCSGSTQGLLETVSHRRLKGGVITHQVSWEGVPLRPASAALTSTTRKD